MTRKHLLPFLIILFLLAACQSEKAAQIASTSDSGIAEYYAGEPSAGPAAEGDFAQNDSLGTVTNAAQTKYDPTQQTDTQERLIIRTGSIDVVVEDTETSLSDIGHLAEQLGGWVVSSDIRQTGSDAKSGSVTIRIPAEEYDTLINRVKEMALEVTWETSNSQDVTDEYVDLTSRLGNLEATADRVRTFLDEAKDVDDALAVNQELSRLEEEIEVIKGRMQYLSQSAAFSTLTVNLTPDTIAQPIEVAGWRPEGTAKDAIETLVKTLQSLADVAIVLVLYLLPLALLFGTPGYILFRLVRSRLRRRRENMAVQPSE